MILRCIGWRVFDTVTTEDTKSHREHIENIKERHYALPKALSGNLLTLRDAPKLPSTRYPFRLFYLLTRFRNL